MRDVRVAVHSIGSCGVRQVCDADGVFDKRRLMCSDVRRYVRNEGGSKTLVQLVSGYVDDGVVAAASHALMNLSVDPISKVDIALEIIASRIFSE